MRTFITADWHIGEDRFQLMGRPFSNIEEHQDYLVEQNNKEVGTEDTLIVVGDVCYQKTPEKLSLVSRFNGNKILIRGNHDRLFTDEQLKPYFSKIIDEGDGIEMNIDNIPLFITHYPTSGKKDKFNLVGHIHAAWKFQLNMLNVGVDVHHFKPVNIESIPFFFKAICEFYDEDVWVAYNELNSSCKNVRGKKSRYIQNKT